MTKLIPLSELARDRNLDLSGTHESPIGQNAYAEQGAQVGRVLEALAEPGGRIRYLLVDVGGWFTSKTVAVPVGLARIENDGVYFDTLTRDQVKNLRAYTPGQEFTFDAQLADESTWLRPGNQAHAGTHDATQEAARSGTYAAAEQDASRHSTTSTSNMSGISADVPMGSTTSDVRTMGNLDITPGLHTTQDTTLGQDARTYNYEEKGELFNTPTRLRLLEERLEVDKERYVAGSVEVGKRVETRTENVNVELQREEIVIERHPVSDPRPVEGEIALGADRESIRVDLEAERADIEKKAVVTEEVSVGKRVETETQTFTENVGKEVLEVNRTGNVTGQGVDVRADQTATESLRESTRTLESDLERRSTTDSTLDTDADRLNDDTLGRP